MNSVVVYIGLGSNLQNPIAQVALAMDELRSLPQTKLEAKSSLYRSDPMGPQDQNDYINAVVAVRTHLPPMELLNHLQAIENQHGRVRIGERWGPRTLDLDILLYGDKAIDLPRLKVPHYGMHERNFVLVPLQEIIPDLKLPDGRSLSELANSISQQGITRLA